MIRVIKMVIRVIRVIGVIRVIRVVRVIRVIRVIRVGLPLNCAVPAAPHAPVRPRKQMRCAIKSKQLLR